MSADFEFRDHLDEVSFAGIFRKLIRDYLDTNTIHGFRHIRNERNTRLRCMWMALFAAIFIFTNTIIVDLISDFLHAPTETSLSTDRVHIKDIAFPAIGFCSSNKFSRKAIDSYTKKMYEEWANAGFDYQQKSGIFLTNSTTEMYDLMLNFELFMSMDIEFNAKFDDSIVELHNFLLHMHNSSLYPTRQIIRDLSPSCEDILVRCYFNKKITNCMDLFYARTTFLGICCTFNYKGRSYPENSWADLLKLAEPPVTFRSAGTADALKIVLRDDKTDFPHSDASLDSFNFQLFYNYDYPDLESGAVFGLLLNYNMQMDVAIVPNLVKGSRKMKYYAPASRYCYFEDEGMKVINQSYYSMSNCLLHCRVQSAMNHCGCIPPMLPKLIQTADFCTLIDLQCLSRWRWKWHKGDLFDYTNQSDVSRPNCPHCYPTCNRLSFVASMSTVNLEKPAIGDRYRFGLLKNLSYTENTSVIRIYFQSTYFYYQIQDISGNWVELLNRFGGICGIMYGFSIICILELIYFVTDKFFLNWGQYGKMWRGPKVSSQQQSGLAIIYFNELKTKVNIIEVNDKRAQYKI